MIGLVDALPVQFHEDGCYAVSFFRLLDEPALDWILSKTFRQTAKSFDWSGSGECLSLA
jgi:hypothetical protein